MKFKKKITLLFALFFALIIQANAQLCGKYETALSIKTADEKPVTNAEIQLLPLEDDETRGKRFVRDEADLSKFSLAFNEGHQIKTGYKLIVSAAGFKSFEKEIKFPHCARRSFIITLEDSNSGAESGLEEIRKIRFWTNNSQGKAVGEVKVSVIRADGKREEKLSNENGGADFEIFNNKKYTFRFEKDGYKTKELEIAYSDKSGEYNTVELERETP